MSLQVTIIEFGALLSYTPHGKIPKDIASKGVMTAVKNDEFVSAPGRRIQMSEFIAQSVKQKLKAFPFSRLFEPNLTVVPTPSSSLKQPNSLWPANNIALALGKQFNYSVEEHLIRTIPLPKSATSSASSRSTALQHFNSLSVQPLLTKPKSILLVDDVVTRGATLLGAANTILRLESLPLQGSEP
jgi:predicted amidophosphoribosyltransferase